MKVSRWFISVMLMMACIATKSYAAEPVNMLKNPSFQGAETTIPPSGWLLYGEVGAGNSITVTNADDQATRALHIIDTISNNSMEGAVGLIQTVPGVPGKTYRFSVWVKALPNKPADGAFIQLRFLPSKEKYDVSLNVENTSAFEEFSVESIAPKGTTEICVYIFGTGYRTSEILLQKAALTQVEIGEGASSMTQQISKNSILWKMPGWLKPNLSLSHPRVSFTQKNVALGRANVSDGLGWGKSVLDNILLKFSGYNMTDEQVRQLMPKKYSYYMYLDDFKLCPDGSPMKWAGLENPGKCYCSGVLMPNKDHPDDGRGWKDEKGNVYYFTARWNGAYVEMLTSMVEPLAQAYALSGDRTYAHKAAVILDALATVYPTAIEGPLDYPGLQPGFEGGRLERPYYQVARVLLKYVNAVDLIWDSGELDVVSATNPGTTVKENIVYNMLLNGADYCYREAHKSGYIDSLGNGTADYNKAILAVGSLLGIDVYIDWVINGPTSIEKMITNNVNRDGLYYETTALYTYVTRQIYLDMAEMLFNLRTSAYPAGVNLYDNERFANLFLSAELLFVAGRCPLYGDSASDNFIGVKSPFDDTTARQLAVIATRTTDQAKREQYWQALANYSESISSLNNFWGVLNTSAFPANISNSTAIRPSEVAGGSGLVLLRSGIDHGAMLRYGPTLNHGNYDELSLLFYANGQEMSFDPGYGNAHYRMGFQHQTVAHLTAVVDGQRQLSAKSAGGSLNYFTTAKGISMVSASDVDAYAHLGVSVYNRTLAMTNTSANCSYIVDIFRIKGGSVHDYSFHSRGSQFTTTGLKLSAQQPGSVASGDYTWHNQIGADHMIKSFPENGFYWVPPGNGYGFLGYPRIAQTEDLWSATWAGAESGAKTRLTLLPSKGREVIVADAPSPMGDLKYVLARDRSDQSQYVAVIDSTGGDFQVAAIEPLAVSKSLTQDFSPVAFAITLAQHKLPATDDNAIIQDIYLATLNGAFTATSSTASLTTDAELAMVRMQDNEPIELHIEKGTSLSVNNWALSGFPAAYNGKVHSVDYNNKSILVSASLPIPEGIVGEYVLISAPEYSHNSPYRIASVTKEGSNYRLFLDTDSFILAKGIVNASPRNNQLPNIVNLPYARNVSRSGASNYYDGKMVMNNKGAQTNIKHVENDYASLAVENTAGFAKDDPFTVYDIKSGDEITIPVAVHFAMIDKYTYELKSATPVKLTVPAKYADLVFVATKDGEFMAAMQEQSDGTIFYNLSAGQVKLGHMAVIKADNDIHIDCDASVLPLIEVDLLELGTNNPVSGANMITNIGDSVLSFTETKPGRYVVKLPVGLKIGTSTIETSAFKDGLLIQPVNTHLHINADWELSTSDVVKVPLGGQLTMQASVIALSDQPIADVKMTVHVGDNVFPMTKNVNGCYELSVPFDTANTEILLRAQNKNGFMREVKVPVVLEGGQILLPKTELRAIPGGTVTVQASFTDSDGQLLKGQNIPQATLIFGFFNTSTFTDDDGDGIATAMLQAPIQPGEYTAHITAEGCNDITIKLLVVSDM